MAKRKRKSILFTLFMLLALSAGIVYLLNACGVVNIFGGRETVPEGTLEVHFIDVGQADSALIKTSEGNILIDCGTKESKETVLTYLSSQGVDKLRYVIFTHPHEDHMGCAPEILSSIEVENIIMPSAANPAKYYERTIDVIEEKDINVIEGKAGGEYTLGGLKITLLSPESEKYKDDDYNNHSIVAMLDFGKTSFMFTGDAESKAEENILKRYGGDINCDVLKVGHHGSNTSTSEDFLKAVSPKYAVISVGEGNSYNHPNEEILLLLEKYNIPYYMTKDEGSIVFVSDGETLTKK